MARIIVNANIEAEPKPSVSHGLDPVIIKKAEEKRIECPATMLKFLLSHIKANPQMPMMKILAMKLTNGLMLHAFGEGKHIP